VLIIMTVGTSECQCDFIKNNINLSCYIMATCLTILWSYSGQPSVQMFVHTKIVCGRVGSVGIVTDYGLDGPGSKPGGDEIFCPSRPALGPTQLPVKWVPGLSGGKVRLGCAADSSPASSAAGMEDWSYTSTHPLGHTGRVMGSLYLYLFTKIYIIVCYLV